MSSVLECLRQRAAAQPERIVLDDGRCTLDSRALWHAVQQVRAVVQAQHCKVIALAGDNTLGWIIADLALLDLPVRVVPLPTFFSPAQIGHVFAQAQVDTVLAPGALLQNFPEVSLEKIQTVDAVHDIALARVAGAVPAEETAFCYGDFSTYEKITFTSGSTGTAKGVRLSLTTLESTAQAIAAALQPLSVESHLGVLPFATLLENIAGLYAPLLQGVRIHVRGLAQLGLASPEQFNPFLLLNEIQNVKPHATILVPQLLLALVSLRQRGMQTGDSFRFIAVGGGKVASALLQQAQDFGLPVYEGYGLSECGSVVALNLPGTTKPDSVGKPLSHCTIRIADDGEIHVRGAVMSGYLGEPESADVEIATGDLGHFDADGFLHVDGRKKNMFITAFGRNVNPEWVEAELLRFLPVRQVAVFGEALPRNVAIVVARNGFSAADVDAAVAECNRGLPDYARIGRVVLATDPFTVGNGLATANGRVRRAAIEQHYADLLKHNFLPAEVAHGIFPATATAN